jgi:TonB family protein
LRSAGFIRELSSREKPVVVPQFKSSSSGELSSALADVSTAENSSSPLVNLSGNPDGNRGISLDENEVLSSLRDLIAAGDHRLDAMLATIAEAARQLTGGSGAALAMWKDGAMVCRARSGDTSPALGARLNADSGISGECLRTGKIQHCTETESDPRVDAAVCRSLGLRSIAVLPIQGWRGVSGILEVFSTQPGAFTEGHIVLLEQLAALAEQARARQPYDASAAVALAAPQPARLAPNAAQNIPPVGVAPAKLVPAKPAPTKLAPAKIASASPPIANDSARTSGLLPASDRVGDVAFAFLGGRSRAVVLGAIGLAALLLVTLVIWLGWRGSDDVEGKSGAPSVAAGAATVKTAAAPHPPDSDLVWKPNPGGEALFASDGKPSAGAPVKLASKVDVIGKKTSANRSPLLADLAGKVAADPSIAQVTVQPGQSAVAQSAVAQSATAQPIPQNSPNSQTAQGEQIASMEPPNLAASPNPSSLSSVLSAKASLPNLTAPISRGVSGGQLVHRVAPVYPPQALLLRLQGTVTLMAAITEQGTVGDVKVLDGPKTLAQSAVEAVKHWRYSPFVLDGKPVKTDIKISVDFKFPSDAASR